LGQIGPHFGGSLAGSQQATDPPWRLARLIVYLTCPSQHVTSSDGAVLGQKYSHESVVKGHVVVAMDGVKVFLRKHLARLRSCTPQKPYS
jgi:hypothetical protein